MYIPVSMWRREANPLHCVLSSNPVSYTHLANSLVGSVSQRLVRTICPHCREKMKTTEMERQVLGSDVEYVYRGAGCHHCNQTGYKGRTAVHEIILIDKEMRKMISAHRDIDEIYAYVKKSQNLHTLKDLSLIHILSP